MLRRGLRFLTSTSSNPSTHNTTQKTYDPWTCYQENSLLLPRLPFPPVQDTLKRYAETIPPLVGKRDLSESEVKSHLSKLTAFANGSAETLNQKLKEIDSKAGSGYPYSYIEEIWDQGYLAYRGPSPIGISPGLGLKPIERIETKQCNVAAQYVHALLRWYQKFISGALDINIPNQTCISQMPAQFGYARIPQPTMDGRLLTKNPTHIIVMHRGHVFRVEIYDSDGKALSPPALNRTFKHIIEATDEDNPYPVGVVTAGGRTDCASYVKELCNASAINAECFRIVQSAFLTVCLDTRPASDYEAKLICMLSGTGDDRYNRFFDKHQLIVSRDGFACFNFEHAFSDGVTWSRWLGEVWHHLNGTTHSTPYTPLPALSMSTAEIAPFSRVSFDVPESLQGIINSASQSWKNATKNVSQHMLISDFGRKRLLQFGISPDAFVQMSFHLAFYRLSGRMAPTYESASTASFWHGRTETIRSASQEMRAFVSQPQLKSMAEGKTSSEELLKLHGLAHAAARKHVDLVKHAVAGLGVDRHLLALKQHSEGVKDAADFFNDAPYGYSGNWQMSSSNVSAPYFDCFCFGPVVEHGYGLGYLIQEDKVACSVSAYNSSRKSNGSAMRDGILEAMRDISVILGSNEAPPKLK